MDCDIHKTMTEIGLSETTLMDQNMFCAIGSYLQRDKLETARLRWLAISTMFQKQRPVYEFFCKI